MGDLSSIKLNPEQKLAVDTIEGPLLIIAGAGSGKTGVITCRIANMLNQGIPQSAILALTFTNKAAREMEERVKELTGRKLSNLTLSTFHAFGVKVLRENITHLGYRSNFTIYDSSDKISCLKAAAAELKVEYENSELNAIAQTFSGIKTGREQWDNITAGLKPLYNEYLDHLRLYNAVDFDDLIVLPIKLFTEHPEVLEKYQRKYKYIMVDEFQDTSLIQYHMVDLIARPNNNLCCVGDDDQSIYSWRGANYGNILQFEEDYPSRKEIKLERNYRSSGGILKAANSVIANNTNRKEKELWTDVGLEDISINQVFPEDDALEADFIVSTIHRIRAEEGLGFDSFGILVRTNSLTKTIENALLVGHVPYAISGGDSFFQRKEIKDIIAYLRIIVNPDDDVSLLRVINTPRRGLGKKALELLNSVSSEKECSLFSAVSILVFSNDYNIPRSLQANLGEFVEIIEDFRDRFFSKSEKLHEVLRDFITELNFWDHLLHEYQSNEKVAKWRYENLNLFCDFLERWETDPDIIDPTLNQWLNRITLINRDEMNDDDTGKVSLMTIHASKGLEFDVVFLAGVEQDIIPHDRAVQESEENIEEERRLFYVAITRARRKLFLSSCNLRKKNGEAYQTQPSPFLEEIPTELIKAVDADDEKIPEEEKVEEILSRLPWKK